MQEIVGEYLLPAEDRERVANSLNFAQAALVLQNSSNIYSRKVEYLYALVYKALDELAIGSKESSSNKKKKKNIDADIDDFLNFDPHQEFLLLDDILPTDDTENCHKINLAEDEEPIDAARTYHSFGSTPRRTATRLSLGNASDRSVASVSAAAHRALAGSLDTGSLRLVGGACDIREDGLLRMPGTNSTRGDPLPDDAVDTPQAVDDEFGGLVADTDKDFGGGDDDDDDRAGFDLVGDYGEAPAQETEPATEEPKRRVTFAEDVMEPQRQTKRSDPWDLLDPHSVDSQKTRPLRIGKTIRLPPGILEPPSECVTGARTRRTARRALVVKQMAPITTQSLAAETFKAALGARKRGHDETEGDESSLHGETIERPSVPIKGLVFGNEFAYIAKATAKRKTAELRERRREQQAQSSKEVDTMMEEEDYVGGSALAGDEDDDDFADGFGDESDGGPLFGNSGMVSVDDAYKIDDENPGTRLN